MKYIRSLICIILVAVLLSGCSFRLASSVNDLISAVAPFGDNADVKGALDSFVTNGYTLKNPSSGQYITSFNFYDIDKDNTDEAVAFYEPSDDLGTINMAVLKQVDSKWKVVANLKGQGDDAFRLDFADIDNDDKQEILVCWNTISNSTSHSFVAYDISFGKKECKISQIANEILINDFVVVDFNQNGSNELLMLEINSGTKTSAKAELYSLSSGKYKLLGETKLDSRVITYRNIIVENVDGDIRVYADAIGSNGNSIRTEIIYWSNMYDSIVSPFYSYSTGRTTGTSRNCLVNSSDINNDGRIDIPTDTTLKNIPNNIKALDWKIYKSSVLMHTEYSLYVKDDKYNIIIPDAYFKDITVKYDKSNRELTVQNKKTKEFVFGIKPVLKAVYNEKDFKDYSIILDSSGYYYLAKSGNDKDIKITVDDLKKNIKV